MNLLNFMTSNTNICEVLSKTQTVNINELLYPNSFIFSVLRHIRAVGKKHHEMSTRKFILRANDTHKSNAN